MKRAWVEERRKGPHMEGSRGKKGAEGDRDLQGKWDVDLAELRHQTTSLKAEIRHHLSQLAMGITRVFACVLQGKAEGSNAALLIQMLQEKAEEDVDQLHQWKVGYQQLQVEHEKSLQTNVMLQKDIERYAASENRNATVDCSGSGGRRDLEPSSNGEDEDAMELRQQAGTTQLELQRALEENETLRWTLGCKEAALVEQEERLRDCWQAKVNDLKANHAAYVKRTETRLDRLDAMEKDRDDTRKANSRLRLELKRRESVYASEVRELARLNAEVLSFRKQALEARRAQAASLRSRARLSKQTQAVFEPVVSSVACLSIGTTSHPPAQELVDLMESQLQRFARVIREQQEQVEVLQSIIYRQCEERASWQSPFPSIPTEGVCLPSNSLP